MEEGSFGCPRADRLESIANAQRLSWMLGVLARLDLEKSTVDVQRRDSAFLAQVQLRIARRVSD